MITIDGYLQLPYTIQLRPESDGTWFVAIKELPGCMSVGETLDDAISMIRDAQKAWIETAMEEKLPIPEPRAEEEYSGNFRLRVPRSLHRKLAEAAEAEGVSLNTVCVSFLAEAVGLTAMRKPAEVAATPASYRPEKIRRLSALAEPQAGEGYQAKPDDSGRNL